MPSKITNRVPGKVKRLEKAAENWTREAADVVKKEMDRLGELPKTGKGKGKTRQRSAGGEAWANQSRDLIESFTKEKQVMKTTLGSAMLRAELEKGYKYQRNGKTVTVDARPTLRTAIENTLPTLENMLRSKIKTV